MAGQNKNKKIVMGVCAAAVVAAVGAGICLMNNRNDGPVGRVIDEDNYQQISEEMSNEVQDGYFETYMNTDWTFADGTAKTEDAVFGNSPNNTKPIRMEVILSDTGEVVYESGVLPVGTELPPFQLDVDLEPGTYDAVCQVYLMKEAEDGSYVDYSDAGFYVTITVEN